jgi:hypothetical protein
MASIAAFALTDFKWTYGVKQGLESSQGTKASAEYSTEK